LPPGLFYLLYIPEVKACCILPLSAGRGEGLSRGEAAADALSALWRPRGEAGGERGCGERSPEEWAGERQRSRVA